MVSNQAEAPLSLCKVDLIEFYKDMAEVWTLASSYSIHLSLKTLITDKKFKASIFFCATLEDQPSIYLLYRRFEQANCHLIIH